MSRSRWFAPAVAVVATAGVVALGSAVPAPPAASEQPAPTRELLSGAVQVCPSALQSPETTAEVAAVSLADSASGASTATGGSAVELVELDGSGAPGVVETVAGSGETVQTETDLPVLVQASGSLAPGLLSEATVSAAGERTSGLASQPCLEPARDLWFAAGSGEVGRRATLLLANPASSAVVVDVELWNETGPLSTAGTSDLGIPAFATRTVALDAVALGSERLAVHVRTQVGRVGAALLLREVDGADPVGLSWVTPSRPPSRLSHVPGLPAFGERRLRLVNPGDDDAIASLRVVAGSGVFTPLGLEAIDVPAGQVVDVDLEPAGEEAFALEIDATRPVVSAVEVRQTPSSGLGDLAVIGSARTIGSAAGSRVSSADGRTSRLIVTAVPEAVSSRGDETEGATPAPTPTATPPVQASPTPTTSPAATLPSTPAPDPAESPTPTPTASPTATPTPSVTAAPDDEPVDAPEPTTQVVVRLLADDSTVVRARVHTLAIGTTEALAVELPDGVTDAWVVIEPTEPNLVLAARETTTTVDVPDPLEPDAEREAFWLDLVALRPAVFTVRVPPVLPDITAGS